MMAECLKRMYYLRMYKIVCLQYMVFLLCELKLYIDMYMSMRRRILCKLMLN